MSSILEALKKLEDEKAARQSSNVPITGKIVKETRRPKKRPKWLLQAEMTAVAAVAVLATYLIMGGRSVPNTEQKMPVNENIQPAPQIPQPPVTRPQGTPAHGKQQLPPSPHPISSAFHSPPSPHSLAKAPFSSRITAKSTPHEGIDGLKSQLERVVPERPAPLPKEDAKPGNPSFKVTGIGWRKDSTDRLAIVNGRPVSEGAMIEGAKVEEIFPDRVRFSLNGKSIEVPLDLLPGETP